MDKKDIKIAIHHRSGGYSANWIEYCKNNNLDFELINCYSSDILTQLENYDLLLWHWPHFDEKANIFARGLFKSLENTNIACFPNSATCWHFDDKIAQKYLLESINAPFAETNIFYEKDDAIRWLENTEYPVVFKLSKGAGSSNVKLIKSYSQALKYCNMAFGKGIKSSALPLGDFKSKLETKKRTNSISSTIPRVLKSLPRRISKYLNSDREKNYIYFQKFYADNQYDTRITIIGNRAFGFRRMVRSKDFRASGSGMLVYDKPIDMDCVKIAFEVAEKIESQSVCMDFVYDENKNPLILEISYAYNNQAVYNCEGHWDRDLNWHEGHLWPEYAIIEDLLNLRLKNY